MDRHTEYRFRLHWECGVCGHAYTSVNTLDMTEDTSLPDRPKCPECGAEDPNFKDLERLD